MHKAIQTSHNHGALPALLLIGLALALVLAACVTTPPPAPQPTAEPTTVPVNSSGDTAEDGDEAPARGSLGSDGSSQGSPNESVSPVKGESSGSGSAGTVSSGTVEAEKASLAYARYQWSGTVVLSELRGAEFTRGCDSFSWLMLFDSPELEAKAINSAGTKIIIWGSVAYLDDASRARPTIAVESVFVEGDAMPRMYVEDYPCGDYPQPAPMPVDQQYSWVGVIVVSDLEGRHLELERGCDSWVLFPETDELAQKLEDSVGEKVSIWGVVSNEPSIYMRQAISVNAAYGDGDPAPAIYIPEYPCGGLVEPMPPVEPSPYYPYNPGIDLMSGEIAALGKLVRDGEAYYLETLSGRIFLKVDPSIVVPYLSEGETLAPRKDGSIMCLESYGYGAEGALPGEADAPVQIEGGMSTEPAAGPVESGVVTVEPSTGVAIARSPYWSGEVMVVGAWYVDGGRLIIAVRYATPWGWSPYPCVYPEPSPLPEPMPVPDPMEGAGVLYGQVRIGPLCPVEPCQNETPDVYSSRALVLESGTGEVIYIKLLPDGWFKEPVKAGVYVVTLTECDFMGCGSALPIKVAVTAGEYTELMLDIDTGIR